MPTDATALDWITGIGQIAAVVFAAWAAIAAVRSADAAHRTLERQERPLLLNLADDSSSQPRVDLESGPIAVPIRNVGRGLANVVAYGFSVENESVHAPEVLFPVAIPAGEKKHLGGPSRPACGRSCDRG
jgi:hypothetical protein